MSDLANAISAAAPEDRLTFKQLLERQQTEIAKALPQAMDAARFIRLVLTEVKRTPKLQQCSMDSVLGGLMLSAQLGLEPGGVLGQCYLIPRNIKGQGLTAVFQLGYHGLTELAARNGWVVTSGAVGEGDLFEWQDGTEPFLRHKAEAWGTPVTHYWAVARKDGFPPAFKVWPAERVKSHRSQFADRGSFAWNDHFGAMAQKTVIADLSRTLQLSPEAERAVRLDGQVIPQISPTIADDHVIDAESWEPLDPTPDDTPNTEPAPAAEPQVEETPYRQHRVPALRQMCEERQIRSDGNRKTLLARLTADDEGFDYDEGEPAPDGGDEPAGGTS